MEMGLGGGGVIQVGEDGDERVYYFEDECCCWGGYACVVDEIWRVGVEWV